MSAKDYYKLMDIDSGNDGDVDDTTSRKRARGDKLSPFLHESVLMECGKGEQQYRRKKGGVASRTIAQLVPGNSSNLNF